MAKRGYSQKQSLGACTSKLEVLSETVAAAERVYSQHVLSESPTVTAAYCDSMRLIIHSMAHNSKYKYL